MRLATFELLQYRQRQLIAKINDGIRGQRSVYPLLPYTAIREGNSVTRTFRIGRALMFAGHLCLKPLFGNQRLHFYDRRWLLPVNV